MFERHGFNVCRLKSTMYMVHDVLYLGLPNYVIFPGVLQECIQA